MKMRNSSKTEHVKKSYIKLKKKALKKISKLELTIQLLIIIITRRLLITERKIMRTREVVMIVIIMN